MNIKTIFRQEITCDYLPLVQQQSEIEDTLILKKQLVPVEP